MYQSIGICDDLISASGISDPGIMHTEGVIHHACSHGQYGYQDELHHIMIEDCLAMGEFCEHADDDDHPWMNHIHDHGTVTFITGNRNMQILNTKKQGNGRWQLKQIHGRITDQSGCMQES